jgi:hypothetical protein
MTWTKVRISFLLNALKRVPRATLCGALIAAMLTLLPETGRSQPCAPVPAGIVGWWTGDNTAQDQVGSAHGTLVGNAGYAPGRVRAAFTFDGSGDAVNLGNPAALQLQDLTIEAWIKRATVESGVSLILSYGSGGYGFGLLDGKLFLARIDSSIVGPPDATVLGGSWHHVAMTKSGSAVVFYIDGNAYPVSAYGDTFTFTTNVEIGAFRGGQGSFNGLIDEVSVYARALSAAEIAATSAAGSSGKCYGSPRITVQPQSQTVALGASASLSVSASGDVPITYRWQRDNADLVSQTNTALNFAAAELSDGGHYSVVVTNAYGAITSSVAVLQVLPANAPSIRINNQLAVGTVLANSPASLTMTGGFSGGFIFYTLDGSAPSVASPLYDAPLPVTSNAVIQAMSLSGDFLQTAVAPDVMLQVAYPLTVGSPGGGGVTANGQAIAPATFYPSGSVVSLQASDSNGWSFVRWQGSASGSANPLGLTMSQPKEVQAIFGTVVGRNVAGSGSILTSDANPVPFGTLLTLTAVPVAGYRFVTWSGVVSGTNNPTSFSVVNATPAVGALFVALPVPVIQTQPTDVSVFVGDTAAFSVTASGAEPLQYQWHKDGALVTGATSASFVLSPVQASHAGDYSVVVSNPYGAATSQVATLSVTVFTPVAITGQPLAQVVAAGETATFQVTAAGYPEPAYQWLFYGTNLPGAVASSLVITNVGTNALGTYHAEVWNAYSAATSAPALLLMSPSIRSAFVGATVTWGKPASISVSAVGSGTLGYQWFKDGATVAGATNATLDFPTVQISDGGLYSVVVNSLWGSTTNVPAQLVVNAANIALGMYAGVTIEGVPGYTYTIQYSTDLTDTNAWVTATNLTLVQPVELWVDTSVNVFGGTSPKRYYRVRGN